MEYFFENKTKKFYDKGSQFDGINKASNSTTQRYIKKGTVESEIDNLFNMLMELPKIGYILL